MSFQFHVGQHVVCIDIAPNPAGGLCPTYCNTKLPVEGRIYTIRRIYDARQFGHDDLAILLEEIRNPVRRYTCRTGRDVRCEQFFLGFRFRPVRTTNIDIFLRMLEPAPERVDLIGWTTRPPQSARRADYTWADIGHVRLTDEAGAPWRGKLLQSGATLTIWATSSGTMSRASTSSASDATTYPLAAICANPEELIT